MISFVIPAHNEERYIGPTLRAVFASANSTGESFEVVVADDASADHTAAIAREHGAKVVRIEKRQIAAARNAGAGAAKGDILFFVDADTQPTPAAVSAALRALRNGAVGGGSCVRFDGRVPAYAVVMACVFRLAFPVVGLAPGCFLFCTRSAYRAAGGFDEALYASEEVGFGRRLKRLGRFVILRQCVVTSARKLRSHTALEMLRIGLRLAAGGSAALRRREGLEFWYDPAKRGS